MAGKLRVTLRKSTVSTTRQARGTVRALGLHRIGQTVEIPDNEATRGMVRAVAYLLMTDEIPGEGQASSGRRARSTRKTQENGS